MYDTTPTLAAIEAEIAALEADDAAQTARVDALLSRPIHQSLTTRLAALQATAAECAALSARVYGEQAELDAELTALGL